MMQPLAGVEVDSLAVNLPGPLAAARLAELGASVTKVEPPSGDPLAATALVRRANIGVGQPYRVALEEAAARAGDAVRYRLMGPGAVLGGAYRIYECVDGHIPLNGVGAPFTEN